MKRFRFSLLSLVVAVVLAGGVGWLNFKPGSQWTELDNTSEHVFKARSYGWPVLACTECQSDVFAENPYVRREIHWYGVRLFADIAIGLAIVLGGAGVCEYAVRRRAKKTET